MIEQTGHISDAVLDHQRQLWLEGGQPDVESLLGRSESAHDREGLLDLLYNEIVVKEELGLNPSLDDYLARYPDLEQDLKLHFEVHRAVNQQLLLETAEPHAEESWPQSGPQEHPGELPQHQYDIQRMIGQGAMAVVYQARHRRLRREVALKVFRPGRMLTPREIARIRTEAEAMARLAHPNLIQIFDIGESQGAPYLALELAEGGTLARRLQHATYAANEAAELILILAQALQHAHDRNIIHRDLKPANILFAKDGTPKITDFGLAKVLEDSETSSADLTRTGEAMGTPRYMSPEQAAGQTERIGPTTDVYALGTLLYECLTGRAPFVSVSVMETMQKIREDDPLPLRRLQPSLPRDLETICLHCLEKDPGRRYSTAWELAEDLQRFLRREPIRIRPATVWEHGWKWCRKRPARATWIALGIILCVSSLLSAVVAAQRERTRIAGLRSSVARWMKDGRQALDRDDLEVAQDRFQQAWKLVQAEPALSDHETSVTGWLDHSRNALNRYHWKQRVPPRDFDDRRDEALLLSLLPFPKLPSSTGTARDAIHSALELTIPKDGAWQVEREQLMLLEAELIAREAGPAAALMMLEETAEFDSRRYHQQRALLLEQLGRRDDAEQALAAADRFPAHPGAARFQSGMNRLRQRQDQQALAELEGVLALEPEHFAARLFQSLCFLHLNRLGEAKVALTACIAQRPRFLWSYYLRGQVHTALGEEERARQDYQSAFNGRASDALREVAGVEHEDWRPAAQTSPAVVPDPQSRANSLPSNP